MTHIPFCDNPICSFNNYECDGLEVITIEPKYNLRLEIRRHEYVYKGQSVGPTEVLPLRRRYFCDTCHTAIQMDQKGW